MKKITLILMALVSFNFGTAQYLTEGFESGVFPPAGWTVNTTNPNFTWQTSTNANNGTGSAEVQYDPALVPQNETLISPAMDLTSATAPEVTMFINMSYFWAVNPNDNYDVTISARQGVTTTPLWSENDLGVFTSFTWIEITLDLSSYAGQNNVFLEINYSGTDGASLNIDDILVAEPPACDIPNNLTFTNLSTTTADFTWTNSGDFDIEWGEFPYTQGGTGGNTVSVSAASSYQLTGLTPGVSYDVYVRQNCGAGLTSSYEPITVGTFPSTVTSFPYNEDLEPDPNQALLLNLGLSFSANTNNWVFGQDDLTDGDTTNDFASDGISYLFSNNTFAATDADATIFFGPFTLSTGTQYTFSVQQRNIAVSDATRPNKDIELVAAATNDGTTNTILSTFDDMNNITHQMRSGSFTPTTSGDYYFGVRDKSNFLTGVSVGNSVVIDAISVTATLSVDDFNKISLTHFYNNNTNSLNVQTSEGVIDNIQLYSLLGQELINQEVSSAATEINMNNLNDGVYIARVTFNGNTQSIKFIKG